MQNQNCPTRGPLVPPSPAGGPMVVMRPTYGPLVETCAAYGIKRSRAFEYAKSGLLDTFTMSTKRYVFVSSLDTLPERIAKVSAEVAP